MPNAVPALRLLPTQHAASVGLRRRAKAAHGSTGLFARQSYSMVTCPSSARRRRRSSGPPPHVRHAKTARRRSAPPNPGFVEAPAASGPCCLLRSAPAARMRVCATVRTLSSKPMQSCQARTVLKQFRACASTRCLTLRSSRAPTAGHAGQQAPGLRPILRLLASASPRRCRLNSNVRRHN